MCHNMHFGLFHRHFNFIGIIDKNNMAKCIFLSAVPWLAVTHIKQSSITYTR